MERIRNARTVYHEKLERSGDLGCILSAVEVDRSGLVGEYPRSITERIAKRIRRGQKVNSPIPDMQILKWADFSARMRVIASKLY